ncbi:MAG: hydrogenase maturation nickel metallochaperone HypA [Candidatus Krumholzibacteria bacterium]|nr:hydrogenase maturation nickel metallochaperone HypA [Candidatus Krumholzibacteria bacterium]
MHEVSLMQNLLRMVGIAASKQGDSPVTEIHLRIGKMAGVNRESLKFSFDILAKGTIAENAILVIEDVPFNIHCSDCGSDFNPDDFTLRCPECEGTSIEITSGREMEIDYILVDDESDSPESRDKMENTGG